MAKGRRHGGNCHERLLGTVGYCQGHVTGTDQPDLGEEDVWSGDGYRFHPAGRSSGGSRADEEAAGHASQWLVKDTRQSPSSVIHQFHSIDSSASSRGRHVASSVPVNIPDWRNILRVDSAESLQYSAESQSSLDEPSGDDGEWIPPHEYLARQHTLCGTMVATSVFEGAGRTLKGRDMSRVRDAVWSQTGFSG